MPDPLLTRAELAARLRVSSRTIQRLEAEGLPRVTIGRQARYRLADIEAWEDACRCASGREKAEKGFGSLAPSAPPVQRRAEGSAAVLAAMIRDLPPRKQRPSKPRRSATPTTASVVALAAGHRR